MGLVSGPVMVLVLLHSAPALVFPDEAFRDQAPRPVPPKPVRLPAIERAKLPNGLQLYVMSRPSVPLVRASLVFPGGAASDAPGKEGTASVCLSLLDRGAGTLDRSAYQAALADLGADIRVRSTEQEFELSLQVLRSNLGPALDLWRDILLHPRLSGDDLTAIVASHRDDLRENRTDPSVLAARIASRVLDRQRGISRKPTAQSLAAITVEDCHKLLRRWVRPGAGRLFIGGAITRAEAELQLGSRFSGWTGAGKPRQKFGPARGVHGSGGQLYYVEVPGLPQAVVHLVHLGPPRKAQDFAATQLAAAIVGSRSTGRLSRRLRSELGYTYSIAAGYAYQRAGGAFAVRAAVKTEVTVDALVEIDAVLRTFVTKGPTEEEVARERDGMIEAIPGRLATVGAILNSTREAIAEGLPVDHLPRLAARLRAVDRDAVRAAARRHLRPDDLHIVVVGSATLLPDLAAAAARGALGRRRLIVLDTEGRRLPAPGAALARVPG